jgi:hypothetical protein
MRLKAEDPLFLSSSLPVLLEISNEFYLHMYLGACISIAGDL